MLFGVLLLNLLLLLGTSCSGQNTKYCSVCRAVVSEAEWIVSQVDPKKSIQVGSFRVDPKGNQKIKDKQYARSEVHLEEVIESVCEKMRLYSEITLDDGSVQMVRTVGFNGRRLETDGLKLASDEGRAFMYKCDHFLEDHEEELISQLQRENIPNYEKLICGEKLGVCAMDVLETPMLTLPETVDEEIQIGETEDSNKPEDNTAENGGSDGDDVEVNDSEATESTDEKTEL
ncbi:unnamed protein product [Candidula unifasciata]|uniref:DUF3456 domain-containing protein n=1 Tax=Candidula unifasciata TaxID=100452 RepID=A0A8S4AG87_9EUPU|nr:unnamed protein product [Candidula unifasciata]